MPQSPFYHAKHNWSLEVIARAQALVDGNFPAKAIAAILNSEPREFPELFFTSSSVIAKMRREGTNVHSVPNRSQRQRNYGHPAKRERKKSPTRQFIQPLGPNSRQPRRQPPSFSIQPVDAPQSHEIAFIDLTSRHCRYPGQIKPYTYCGGKAHWPQEPYCSYHTSICLNLRPFPYLRSNDL